MLRLLTSGESHGPALTAILDGLPSGLLISEEEINASLTRRGKGYGRGGRMKIEKDAIRILSGLARGKTTGAPLTLLLENKDDHLKDESSLHPITCPRPGHADLAGLLKYNLTDIREVSERASARETAIRAAAGAVAATLLRLFQIQFLGIVRAIGTLEAPPLDSWQVADLKEKVEGSELRVYDRQAEEAMKALIDSAREEGDSLGGIFVVIGEGIPPGLGSYAQWDRRIDGQIGKAVLSIPGVKGVEIGTGFLNSTRKGSQVHDGIGYRDGRFVRFSNRAGGVEGGVTNGEQLWVSAAMKPIPTLKKGMPSVDLRDKAPARSHYQRADVCAVPAASVVGEAVLALVVAGAFLEKFGGDSIQDVQEQFFSYMKRVGTF